MVADARLQLDGPAFGEGLARGRFQGFVTSVEDAPSLCRRLLGLLGRPVSEYGRLCHGEGGHEGPTAAGGR